MHDFIYNLGIVGLIIIFFYLVFWFDRRNEPREFDLVRNHLQRITHPGLIVQGYGDYYIEYIMRGYQTFEYFKSSSQYEKSLEQLKKEPSIKILKHGLLPYKAWEKWDI